MKSKTKVLPVLCDKGVCFRSAPHLEHIKACQARILILYHVCVTAGLSGHLSAEVHRSAGCGARVNCGGACLQCDHTQTSNTGRREGSLL